MSLAAEQAALADAATDDGDQAHATANQEEQEIVAVGTVSHVVRRAFLAFYPEAADHAHAHAAAEGDNRPSPIDPSPVVAATVDAGADVATPSPTDDPEDSAPTANSYVLLGDSRKQLIQETRALKQTTCGQLLVFLDQQYRDAQAKDDAIAADLARQGLIIKSQIPMGPTNLQLRPADLERFGPAGASLLHASTLVREYHRTRLDRSGNSASWQARQAQSLHREPPGYLNPTSTYAVRKDTTLATYQPFIDAVKASDKQTAETTSDSSPTTDGHSETDSVMPAHEKRKNLAILARMQDKLDFLRNPRYTEADDAAYFVAEPSPVQFTDYDVGGVYEQTIYIRNTSALSRRVRVLPPATLFFSIDRVAFPDASGLVAPGMHVAVVLRFAPDSRADYKDELVVQSEGGTQFALPLLARRAPPELSIPLLLRALPTLLGAHSVTRFPCKNTGGKARFWLMSEPEWHRIEASATYRSGDLPTLAGDTLTLGAFSLSLTGFELDTNQSTTLELAFRPSGVGEQREKLVMVCDNGLVRVFQLAGRGCQLELRVCDVNGQPVDAGRASLGDVDQLSFPGELLVNATATQTVSVRNDAPVDLRFAWRLEGHQQQSSPFSIQPASGLLPASDVTPFTVEFAPRIATSFTQWRLVLDIQEVPPCSLPGPHQAAQLAAALQNTAAMVLGTVHTLHLRLRGVSRLGSFRLQPPTTRLTPDLLQCGHTYEATTTVANPCDASVAVQWDLPRASLAFTRTAEATSLFRLTADWTHAELAPLASRQATFRFTPLATGAFTVVVPCVVANATTSHRFERWFMLEGSVATPTLRIRASELDFGLVLVGATASAALTIANDSPVAAADWSLAHIEAATLAPPPDESSSPTLHRSNSKDSVRSRHSDRSSNGSLSMFSSRDLPPRASLQFQPASGSLAPGASLHVTVVCHGGGLPERFRGTIALATHAKFPSFPGFNRTAPAQCVSTRAEIQSPNVFLSPLKMPLGTTYLGVAVERVIELVNVSNLDADFRFSEPQGVSKACAIECLPAKGTLLSKQTLAVTLRYTARQAGKTATLLACAVKGLPLPLGLEVVATHKGLVLTYDVLPVDAVAPAHHASEADAPEATATVPKLVFGDAIPLTHRRSLQLLVRNWSGIEADIEIEPKRYTAAEIEPPRGRQSTASLASTSSSSSSRREIVRSTAASSKRGKAKTKTPLLLSDAHEPAARFQSEKGKEYLQTQRQQAEDKALLRDGRGAAFLVTMPSNNNDSHELTPTRRLRIAPWGSAVVHVSCLNNLPGSYSDGLACRAAGLPPVVLPLLATVVGSPLALDTNCVGLRVPKDRPPTLSFGHTCVRAAAITKTLHVVNRGPQAARLKWRIVENGKENAVVHVSLQVDVAARVQLRITAIDHDDADDRDAFPFEVVPPHGVVPPFASSPFRVTYFPPAATAVARALLVADALWLPTHTGDLADSTLEDSPLATDSRDESSVVPLSKTRLTTAAGKALQAVRVANSLARSSSNNSPHTETSSSSSTPKCLRVLLAAAAVDPALSLDKRVQFTTWSTLLSVPAHAFHRRELELTNRLPTRATFRLEATGPFAVASAESLAPRHPLAPAELPPAHRRADGEAFLFTLPPRLSVRLTLRLDPQRLAGLPSHGDKLVLTAAGELLVRFTNQSVQRLPLTAEIRRPVLLASPAVHCFGRVHLARTRRVVLRLANPTVVPAAFAVRHVPRPTPLSKAQRQETATHHARFVDDPSVFTFSATSGVVHGPTLSLRAAGGAPQPAADSAKDLLDAATPLVRAPLELTVAFHPHALGQRYKSRFRLQVEHGVDFDVVLEGEGHLDEREYRDQDRSMVRARELTHRSVIFKRLPLSGSM